MPAARRYSRPMAMLSGPGYPISRSTGVCAASGRRFENGERYVATLVEKAGEEALERQDFAEAEWERGARPSDPYRLFASWRTSMVEHPARRKTLLSDGELLELFERLNEATEPKQLSFRYLLALMLVRRKMLRYEGTRDGVMTVRMKPATPGGPEPEAMAVPDPKLDDEAVAAVLQQLGEIMSVEPAGGSGVSA